MTPHLPSLPTAQDQLIEYLKSHQILRLEDVLWQWLGTNAMPPRDILDQIDQLKTWLDAFRPLSPAVVAELRQRYLVRFTYHSNALEGNTLTQSETELVLTTGITIGGKTLQEHLEVIGHRDAIAYIEALAQQSAAIGEWETRQIHSLILRAIAPAEAGNYRTLDVQAAGTGYTYPPHYLLSELMSDYISWLNSEASRNLHPVLYAAEAHHRFVTIHPFRDGNGRVGRLLMNLLLLKAGYPVVIISAQNRQQYIESLIQGQQLSNWQPFCDLIATEAKAALIEMLSVLVTASDSQNQDSPIYREILEFLERSGS